MNIAQCFTCHVFCDLQDMWLKDRHVYCDEHKPEGAESMHDAVVFYEKGEIE